MEDWQKRELKKISEKVKALANNPKQVTVNFPEETLKAICYLSEKTGLTRTEILTKSIGLYGFVKDIISNGGKILIEDKNGEIREVILD